MEDETKTDRLLPAGWGWRRWLNGIGLYLYAPGNKGVDFHAAAYPDGSFSAYASVGDEVPFDDRDTGDSEMSAELLAAAQREAEAALWARDGFGVGRVYGARLAMDVREASHYVASRRPVALPGLGVPGLWRVTAAREVEGLTEIDAVRAPDTQAEADAAPLTHALDAEGNALCPYDAARLAYVSPRPERVTCPTCREKTAEPAPARSLWSVAAEMQGEPAGHRVAALLRAVEEATTDAVEETDDRPDHVRTGRPFAYVEGLREAARLVREHLDAPSPEDFAKLPRLSDAEIQTALNKGRSEAFPAHHPFAAHLAAPSPLDAVADVREAQRAFQCERADAAERRAEHEPAGRVAALLRAVEEERADAAREAEKGLASSYRSDQASRREAWTEAARLVREYLAASSPLDLAVAEVCAVDAAEVADTFDAWAALGDICRAEADGLAEERAQFAKAGRVALAGMLACDAKGGSK